MQIGTPSANRASVLWSLAQRRRVSLQQCLAALTWRRVEMSDSNEAVLEPATLRDAAVLSNLLELYSHDLSDVFALEPGVDGRFGYEKLPLYWSEPESRLPFLIRAGTRLAGFALVTRGSPASGDRNDCDIAEFFVLRRHRRHGVG